MAASGAHAPNRNFGLDLLRFLAIFIVLVHHWAGGFLIRLYPESIQQWTLLGFLGVEIFFVLSGFLIGTILIKTFLKENDYSAGMIKNFWVRRWYRTLPLYYVILIVFFIFFHYKHF